MLYNMALKVEDIVTLTEAFQLLNRVIQNHSTEDAVKILIIKDLKDIASTSLQNPTDKDETYRNKYGGNVGYIINIQE